MNPKDLVACIISGGQTGADRGGLEAGLALGIPVGGTCPKGRRAEDGKVPDKYPLVEHDSPEYPARTLTNVLAADCTLVLYVKHLELGSKFTVHSCAEHKKPCCPVPIDKFTDIEAALQAVRPWLERLVDDVGRPLVLNVAGNRETRSPGIQVRAQTIVTAALQGFLL